MTDDVSDMPINLRPGLSTDVAACARIFFEAFGAIAAQHNFPSDVPSIEVGTELMTMLLTHPGFFSVWQSSMEESSVAIFLTSGLQSPE